jgi:hypothetical protein
LTVKDKHEQFVAFVDILGFRALVLGHRVPRSSTLAPLDRMGFDATIDLLGDLDDLRSPLRRCFVSFHEILRTQLNKANSGDDLTAVVFSDSFFLATEDWYPCLRFCQAFMRSCIAAKIPVRMGVGYGSFSSNRFAIETMKGMRIVSTEFLGSAVVFATDAEKAVKGMRIALHPTVLPTIGYTNAKPYKFLSLPAEECSEAAIHELNYSDSSFLIGEAPDGDTAASLLRYVADMKGHAPALPHIQVHYEQTSRALETNGARTGRLRRRILRQIRRRFVGAPPVVQTGRSCAGVHFYGPGSERDQSGIADDRSRRLARRDR